MGEVSGHSLTGRSGRGRFLDDVYLSPIETSVGLSPVKMYWGKEPNMVVKWSICAVSKLLSKSLGRLFRPNNFSHFGWLMVSVCFLYNFEKKGSFSKEGILYNMLSLWSRSPGSRKNFKWLLKWVGYDVQRKDSVRLNGFINWQMINHSLSTSDLLYSSFTKSLSLSLRS